MVCRLGLAIVAVSMAALHAQSSPEAVALANKIQHHLNGLKDFQGEFVQTYEGGVLRTKTTERGTVAIKRPGKMRFVYTKPEKKEFVSDGARLYTYLVADKQVIVSPAPGAGDGTIPALFLAGQADIPRDYVPAFTPLPGAAPGLLTLKLTPKKADPDYEWLGLGMDPKTSQILYLVAADRQGGTSQFVFSNLKENRGLADKDFEFRVPRGVEVVTNAARAR